MPIYFDIAMGGSDSAQITDLVRAYMLSVMQELRTDSTETTLSLHWKISPVENLKWLRKTI